MAQGKSSVNGPHQGAWVDTAAGEDWFIHFQDVGPYGRVVHLQPMVWKDGWPVIGEDKGSTGCGEPVQSWKKPNTGKTYPLATPAESDEFSSNELGLQWQWHANPQDWWHFANASEGCLSLYSVPVPEGHLNLWDVPNLLLQKLPARAFTATAKLTFKPNPRIKHERAGLLVMGLDYAHLSLENTEEGLKLSQVECKNASQGGEETSGAPVKIPTPTVFLQVKVKENATCSFAYSTDGKRFSPIGRMFTLKEGKWIGAKIGFFCSRPVSNNDGGRIDIDWFRIME